MHHGWHAAYRYRRVRRIALSRCAGAARMVYVLEGTAVVQLASQLRLNADADVVTYLRDHGLLVLCFASGTVTADIEGRSCCLVALRPRLRSAAGLGAGHLDRV